MSYRKLVVCDRCDKEDTGDPRRDKLPNGWSQLLLHRNDSPDGEKHFCPSCTRRAIRADSQEDNQDD